MATWFYLHDDVQAGPVSTAQMKELVATGQLGPTDFVWMEGMANWVEARNVKNFFPTKPGSVSPSVQNRQSRPAAAKSPAGATSTVLAARERKPQVAPQSAEATKLLERADALFSEEDWWEAGNAYNGYLAKCPNDGVALSRRAICLAHGWAEVSDETKEAFSENLGTVALQLLEKAIQLAPNDAVIRHNKGCVLHILGMPAQALAAEEVALAIQPDYAATRLIG